MKTNYQQAKELYPNVDDRYMYRVRGINPYSYRDVWYTKSWSRTLADAQLTMRTVDHRWTKVRIIKKSIGEYMREHQKVPRFS
jgi:hypothetical protein